MTRRYRNYGRAPSATEVLCTCWCDTNYVWVHPDDVLAGRTITCHLPNCKPPQEKP